MRARNALTFLTCSALAVSMAFIGCGNGDDSTAQVKQPVADAGADVTVSKDGGPTDAGGGKDGSSSDGATATTAALKHVYVIMMENHAYSQIIGDATDAPNMNMLVQKYGQATKYYGVTHPSLPNYLAAISGDFQGIFDDCNAGPTITCQVEEFVPNSGDGTANALMTAQQAANAATIPHWFSGRTIIDQLEEHGMTWKAYMGDIPATGDVSGGAPADVPTNDDGGTETGNLYAQKHDPFMYFQSIRNSTNRMQKIVPSTNLAADLMATSMPNFVWISPDQCEDMHSVDGPTAAFADAGFCTGSAASNDMSAPLIQYGDAYVGNTVKAIMASPTWSEGSAIAIVFDEDDYVQNDGCCNSPTGQNGVTMGGAQVPAIVISSLVTSPTTSADPYNHYSLLATIQHLWGFDCLANTCGMAGSQLMTKLFTP
jgi:phosphatidylinositol-3-phosphatase